MAEDDIGASDEYAREIDEEAEFLRMQQEAMAANQRAHDEGESPWLSVFWGEKRWNELEFLWWQPRLPSFLGCLRM